MSVFSPGPGNGIYTKSASNVLGLGATVDANGAFVASTGPVISFTATNPSGVVTANAGSLALSSGAAYIAKGGSTWTTVTGVPAGSKGGYQRYAMTTQTSGVGDNTSGIAVPLPNSGVTYAAGSLVAGTSIRIRLAGTFQVSGSSPNTAITVGLALNGAPKGLITSALLGTGTSTPVVLDYQLAVVSVGPAGIYCETLQGSIGSQAVSVCTNYVFDTTVDNTFSNYVSFSTAGVGTRFGFLLYNVDFYP